MKLDIRSSTLLALTSLTSFDVVRGSGSAHRHHQPEGITLDNRAHRTLQTTSCLAEANFTASFTAESCTSDLITLAISTAISDAGSACDGASASSELSSLLGTSEDGGDIATALQTKCDDAFAAATLPFGKITRRGDAFDREFFAGGSDWNDQRQISSVEGTTYHNLKYDASRIMYETHANTAAKRPIEFPEYLPSFDNCDMGSVMCCHVSDRQSNDLGGTCAGESGSGDGCADADPAGNTDVCVASIADAPISNRVQKGLAVYHLNDEGNASDGEVNCHGFAWDSVNAESGTSRYKGNMLFDVAFKQSLYDRGYVKNVPGAPMCGCVEQMPTVTRADCTKITSVAETYTLSATLQSPTLDVKLSDSGVQYGPCDAGEDLAGHYKDVNGDNAPDAIDSKLVGEGNCLGAIDSSVAAYGYKRSVLEVTEAYFTPLDVNPVRVTVKFNAAVSDAAATEGSFKVYDAANPTVELGIASSSLKYDNTAVELILSSMPSSSTTYQVSNVATLHKRIAPMVTLEANAPPVNIVDSSWDFIELNNWRIGRTCETCSNSHFSISSEDDMQTSQIFRDTGTTHKGPRSDFNTWDVSFNRTDGATYSTDVIQFGYQAVQIRDWRIRQIDETHLSISHENGNVARTYRSDGTVHGNNQDFSGYSEALGEPTCAYATSDYLQIGDWRFGAYDTTHLSVSHRLGQTSMIYRTDGTMHKGPRRDYNTWTWPEGEPIMGSKEGCAPLDPFEPNVLQIGQNWKLAQMYDDNHFSVSSRQPNGSTGNAAQTAMVYRNDGRSFNGPRTDYNAWGDVPTYSNSPPKFGDKTLEIDNWRIRQVDSKHLSVTHVSGGIARLYRSDGQRFDQVEGPYSSWADPTLGEPTCAFVTEKFVQLGDWRIGEFDDSHLSVSHKDGFTSFIYHREGTAHPGPRTDYGTWGFPIGTILQGSASGCASIEDATLIPENEGSPTVVAIKFNRDLANDPSLASSFKIYDTADPTSELAIASSAVRGGASSILELTLATAPAPGITYQVTNIQDVQTSDPLEVVVAGTALDVTRASWDYIQIANWRIARTCETCSNSHFSISSDNTMTSQIFRDTGTTHKGPRNDYNGWDVGGVTGLTYSVVGVQYGNLAVQIRDWRIRQIDETHLSISHENGNVARIYRSDGTVHGNVQGFSGYNEALGEPTCAYATSDYLQIGDWRFGAYDDAHLSVTHRLGQTPMIYRTTGTIHGGPRMDFDAWSLPEGEVVAGSNAGCESSTLFG